MADTTLFLSHGPTEKIPIKVFDNGDGTYSMQAGTDAVIDIAKVEQRFASSGVITSDTAVKSGAGFVHTITIAPADAAPTAGTITVYDNTTNSGTKLFEVGITTTWFAPASVLLDASFATGCYVDFTTTADVNVVVSYR